MVSSTSNWTGAATLCLEKHKFPVTPAKALGLQGIWEGPAWTGVRRNKAVFLKSTGLEGTFKDNLYLNTQKRFFDKIRQKQC